MKQFLIAFLRSARLLPVAEQLRSFYVQFKQKNKLLKFKSENPSAIVPSWDIAYDAYGGFDPDLYQALGESHASKVIGHIKKYAAGISGLTIADWGCGPMRVLRLLPDQMHGNSFVGLDYNGITIDWAKKNYPDIKFLKNELMPPLPLEDNSVDVLYCISVFTHLSEEVTVQYIADIYRVLKKDGLLIATLHGDLNAKNLTPSEYEAYQKGDFVVRGNVEEGKRIFVSYHPEKYVSTAFAAFKLLERDTHNEFDYFKQEWWVFKK